MFMRHPIRFPTVVHEETATAEREAFAIAPSVMTSNDWEDRRLLRHHGWRPTLLRSRHY